MRYLIVLAIVLTSMCISNVQQASVILEDNSQTDVFLKAEAIPTQVRTGRSLDMIFEIRNKREDSITNATLLAYDQCVFSGDSSRTFQEIKSNETKRWSWKWETGSVNFERDCSISFKLDYSANFSRSQSIAVITENEYNQRDAAGTLSSITTSTSSTTNPIDVIFSFSKSFPLLEGDRVSIFIDYINKENGLIDKLDAGDIKIKTTRNMDDIDCNDYDLQGDELVLNRNLKFFGGKAPRSTCTFTATVSTTSPVDVQTINLIATYKYSLDNSLAVKVIP